MMIMPLLRGLKIFLRRLFYNHFTLTGLKIYKFLAKRNPYKVSLEEGGGEMDGKCSKDDHLQYG
jgi:hypothetical protein